MDCYVTLAGYGLATTNRLVPLESGSCGADDAVAAVNLDAASPDSDSATAASGVYELGKPLFGVGDFYKFSERYF